MSQYDGSIRINTKIDSKEASSQLMTLENRIVKTADKISSLRSKMDALKDTKIPTQEYQNLQKELNKLILQQSRYNEQLKEFDGVRNKENLPLYQELSSKLEDSYASADKLISKMRELSDEGKAFTLGADTEEFSKLGQQLRYAENDMAVLNRRHEELIAKQGKASEGYKKFGESVRKSFSSIGNVLKKANSAVNSFGRKIKDIAQKHLPFFRKETEKAKSSLSGFAGRLKSLALSLLIFNQISAAFRKVSSSISSGFKNLYEDNERFRSSIDGLKASVLTLENAFAAAFRPIVDIAVPYIQKLVAWLTEAVNLAGQFIAALTGRKTYTRAIKQSAAASEEAAEATEEETEAMKKQLSPLDKLNVLTSENAKNKEKDKDTGLGAGIGTMFEEVPIESGILDAVEKFKDILSRLLAPLKEAWEREGQFVMDSWKYALDEVWKLIKDIGRDFLIVWNQEATIRMFQDILHIIGDIGLIAGNLARNFRDAWNESQTGLHILENIRDIFAAIIHNIRLAADFTAEWAGKLNFSPLLQAFERFTASLVPVVDALSGVLTDFYTKVLLPLGKWVLEKGLPELLDVFTAFNKKVDWEALRRNLAEFWEHLEPFAETVGEGLIIFIERISELVANFINSETFVNFLHNLEDWMDSVTPEDVADGIEKLAKAFISFKLAILGFSALKGLANIIEVFTKLSPLFKGLTSVISKFAGLFSANGIIGGAISSLGGIGNILTANLAEFIPTVAGAGTIAEIGVVIGTGILGGIAGALGGGVVGKLLDNYILAPLFSFDEELSEQYKNFKWFGEEGFFAKFKSSITDGSWKSALDLWAQDINDGLDALFGINTEPFYKTFGEIKDSFTDGSWKEALSLWGEDLKAGIKSVGEFIKDDWNNSYMGQMISSFTDGSWKKALELWGSDIKESWSRTWTFAKDKVTSIFQTIESIIGSAVAWISGKIQSILNLFSQVSTAAKRMTSGALGSAMGGAFGGSRSVPYSVPYSANPAFAALSTTPIPKLATGTVIPANREFLAVLGDQKHGTNVEAPLDTIRQASEEAFLNILNRLAPVINRNGEGNRGDIVINIDGREVFRAVQKSDREFFKQTGRHAFT